MQWYHITVFHCRCLTLEQNSCQTASRRNYSPTNSAADLLHNFKKTWVSLKNQIRHTVKLIMDNLSVVFFFFGVILIHMKFLVIMSTKAALLLNHTAVSLWRSITSRPAGALFSAARCISTGQVETFQLAELGESWVQTWAMPLFHLLTTAQHELARFRNTSRRTTMSTMRFVSQI